jgi:hypothetical protein
MVKKATNSIKVDFTGVETGGFEIPDGAYVLAVQSVAQKKGQETGQPYLAWEFKVDEGKYKGRKVWDNTSLQPQALWKLRGMLEAMDMDIEDGEFELDLSDFEGMKVGAEIANEKYQGKDKPRVVGYMPELEVDSNGAQEDEEEEEEEKKPASKPKASTKKKPEPEPEPEEEEQEEEQEEEEKKPAAKTTSKKKKTVELEVGMAVTFEDEGEEYKGKIHSVGDDTVEVKVGKDIWELEKSEVTPA